MPLIAALTSLVGIELLSSSARVTSVKSPKGVGWSQTHADPKIGPQVHLIILIMNHDLHDDHDEFDDIKLTNWQLGSWSCGGIDQVILPSSSSCQRALLSIHQYSQLQ